MTLTFSEVIAAAQHYPGYRVGIHTGANECPTPPPPETLVSRWFLRTPDGTTYLRNRGEDVVQLLRDLNTAPEPYVHHRCSTCRHTWSTPGSRVEPPDGGCSREDDIEQLIEIRLRKKSAAGADDDELGRDELRYGRWGDTEDCPLWESIPLSVCPVHGRYSEADGCLECEVDAYEIEDVPMMPIETLRASQSLEPKE